MLFTKTATKLETIFESHKFFQKFIRNWQNKKCYRITKQSLKYFWQGLFDCCGRPEGAKKNSLRSRKSGIRSQYFAIGAQKG
jgi:hypothetical protein